MDIFLFYRICAEMAIIKMEIFVFWVLRMIKVRPGHSVPAGLPLLFAQALLHALHGEAVHAAGGNGGHVCAGLGILAVDIKGPVGAVLIVVGGDSIDRFDIQAVLAVFPVNNASFCSAAPTVCSSVCTVKVICCLSASITSTVKEAAPVSSVSPL